jgi:hypothetical protein
MATKAKVGDTIRATIYIAENYPAGSLWKVHKIIESLNEVVAYPTWYEEGMKCFGYCVCLENDDYELEKPSN